MKEVIINVPESGVVEEMDNDKVLDFINLLPSDISKLIYNHFDKTDGDVNVSFCVDNMHCFIHKFSKEGDTGLVYALSFSKEDLCFFIEQKFDEEMAATIVAEILNRDEGNTETNTGTQGKNGLREASKKEEKEN